MSFELVLVRCIIVIVLAVCLDTWRPKVVICKVISHQHDWLIRHDPTTIVGLPWDELLLLVIGIMLHRLLADVMVLGEACQGLVLSILLHLANRKVFTPISISGSIA